METSLRDDKFAGVFGHPRNLRKFLPRENFFHVKISCFTVLNYFCGLVAMRRRSHCALAHFASHRCCPSSIPGLGRGRMCEKFHQLLAVDRWFPPGTPVSSTRKLISSSSFRRLDMTLAVAEALAPNKPNQTILIADNHWLDCDNHGENIIIENSIHKQENKHLLSLIW